MPRTKVYEQGPSLSSSLAFRGFVAVDVGVLLGVFAWGVIGALRATIDPTWFGWLAAAYAAVTLPVALRCVGLWAGALVWRRRLSLFAVLAVLWRGSPVSAPELQVVVTLYTAALWIVMLLEGKRVAHAVSEATGEEVYTPDPSRRVDH